MHPSPAPPVTKDSHLQKKLDQTLKMHVLNSMKEKTFEGNGMAGRLSKDNVVYIMKTTHAYYHS